MTIPRFFVTARDLTRERVVLSGADHHHLSRVLRAKVGDEVRIQDGCGGTARALIVGIGREATDLEVTERWREEEERPRLHLFQALLKGARMDLVVEAAAELGVSCVAPFACRRSRALSEETERRVERWRAICLQSSRVAGRLYLPEVFHPLPWEEMLGSLSSFDRVLFADEQGGERPAEALEGTGWGEVALVVGPEGGFEDTERDELRARGARPVSLGPYVLRAEYAGMVLVAAARCACGLL
ncbi:MAG: 16S rRNA (uracil(1498)-N(3))-methyltransferase [Actinobacteria bacterium]|nr:16S rRNA (uracil(1498)-N(3))-methyltransferase [Actinomycetota bacterium]